MNTFYVSIRKHLHRWLAIALCTFSILSPASRLIAANNGKQIETSEHQYALTSNNNLALGKTVTCSSEPEPTNNCSNVVDGDLSNRWSAQGYPQSVEIDLGETKIMQRVILYTHQNRAYQYVVEVKESLQSAYVTVVDRGNNQQDGTILEDEFASVNARYVRLRVVSAAGYTGGWVSIREVELFATPHPQSSLTFCPARFTKDVPLGEPSWAGSYPTSFVELNGIAYFAAYDGSSGLELWRTDATENGTWRVKDINPGYASAFVPTGAYFEYYDSVFIHKVDNQLLFFAHEEDAANTIVRLWHSDGTNAGTYPISSPLTEATFITEFQNKLYFWASDGAQSGLWMSNGTVQGTQFVKAIDRIITTTLFKNTLYFLIDQTLWRSDGTTAGTELILQGQEIRKIVATSDNLFLSIYSGASTDLWVSDGTSSGTNFVKIIHPFSDVFPGFGTIIKFDPGFTVAGEHLFLIDYEEQSGYELWMSDGTVNGTRLVKDIGDSLIQAPAYGMWAFGNMLIFVVDDGVHGRELWQSDGTDAGTRLISDLFPGSDSGFGWAIYHDDNLLFFYGSDGTANQTQIWKLDGATLSINFVRANLSPTGLREDFTKIQDIYYFVASDPEHGPELWRTDGTPANTSLVKDIWPGSQPGFHDKGNPSTDNLPSPFTYRDRILFSADDGIHSGELWISDGTESGTKLVKDINRYREGMPPMSIDYTAYVAPHGLVSSESNVFFIALHYAGPSQMWSSDGSTDGTSIIFNYQVLERIGIREHLFFSAYTGSTSGIFRSDGTAAGTQQVHTKVPMEMVGLDNHLYFLESAEGELPGNPTLWEMNASTLEKNAVKTFPGVGQNGSKLFALDGRLYVASGDDTQFTLWKGDDTNTQFTAVKTFSGYTTTLGNAVSEGNGSIYFSVGNSLWKSDGTETGTIQIKSDFLTEERLVVTREGIKIFDRRDLITTNDGQLYFIDHDSAHGEELWTSDGTAAGTRFVKDIRAGIAGSSISWKATVADTLFFVADDGLHGVELWKSDGTEAGTIMVTDLNPGEFGSNPAWLTPLADGTILFSAFSDANGVELWQSDGTPLGTQPLTEINPGVDSANPSELTWVGNRLYFRADTIPNGNDIWSIGVSSNGLEGCQGLSQIYLPSVAR